MSRDRAERLIEIVNAFQASVRDLDTMQIGDVKGVISPIKHKIMELLAPELERLREIAQREYLGQ